MEKLKELQDLAIWMSGCGYDFTQHEHFLKNKHLLTDEAINYTHCCTELPDELQPVIAKIEHTNSLGISNYWEVVYYDNKNWHSYQGSKTFEDGEKVVKWNYCKAIV
tara:strand:+ start:192 stop:512 length:321 start_codon:yes stop_codon:yes gene_type:complete